MRKDVCFLCRPINFYRAKRVMQYDVTSQKAFITEKDTKETLHYLWLLFKEACKINREFDEAFHKILLCSGVQLMCTGIAGEYLAKTYLEVKHRPIYIVAETEEDLSKKELTQCN